jgi:methanogenic corrinoid protein MtbC1
MENMFGRLLRELVSSLNPLDRVTFEKRLNGAVAVIPFDEALHGILLPLQEQVGQLWHDGHIDVAVEHYVTNHIQQKIFSAMNQLPVAEFGATVVVACPPGEEHGIGALAVAYHCRVRGCRVYYLGANVPLAALIKLCSEVKPDLTILSFPVVPSEARVTELVQALVHEVIPVSDVALGGHGAVAMRNSLMDSHIMLLEDFADLDSRLDRLMRKHVLHR